MKTKYAVKTKFFDNGRINSIIFSCDVDYKNSSISRKICDEYIDVFNTYEEAKNWQKEAYNA
jgi:hypothetical protein